MNMAISLRSRFSRSAQTILLCAGEPEARSRSAYTMKGVSISATTAPASGPTGDTRSSMANRQLVHRLVPAKDSRGEGNRFRPVPGGVGHVEYGLNQSRFIVRVVAPGDDGIHGGTVRIGALGELPDGVADVDVKHGPPPLAP